MTRKSKIETFYLHEDTKSKIVEISKQTNHSMSKVVKMAIDKLKEDFENGKV